MEGQSGKDMHQVVLLQCRSPTNREISDFVNII